MPRYTKKWAVHVLLLSVATALAGAREAAFADAPEQPDNGGVSVDGPVLLQLNPPLRANFDSEETVPPATDAPNADTTDEEPSPEMTLPEEPPKKDAAKPNPESVDAEKKTEKETTKQTENQSAPATQPEPKTLPPLDENMVELRDYVRKTLAFHFRQPLNTRDNTAADVLDACLAFGCDTEIQRAATGETVNGFTCLCWNYPCAGYRLLKSDGRRIVARVGYGTQRCPSQFLAVLALARVPANYPIRVGEDVRSVQNLVDAEKAGCRSGIDLSCQLIGLMRYIPDDKPWKNDLGETWTKQRLVKEVLDQPVEGAPRGGTRRLLALGYAVDRRLQREKSLDGQYLRAQKYLDKFVDYALSLQNPDGSWHPEFFAYRGSGGTGEERLRSTGHILEWLVCSVSDQQLRDPRIARAVGYVGSLLNNQRQHRGIAYNSSRQLGSRMHALHALVVYDARVFKPHDEVEQPAEEEPAVEKTATRPVEIRHPDITRLPKI